MTGQELLKKDIDRQVWKYNYFADEREYLYSKADADNEPQGFILEEDARITAQQEMTMDRIYQLEYIAMKQFDWVFNHRHDGNKLEVNVLVPMPINRSATCESAQEFLANLDI